ncbi:unnamed protein product [Musa textilis]
MTSDNHNFITLMIRYWEIARKMIQSICCALKSTFISPESQSPGMLEVQPAPLSRNNSSNKMELLISSVREERCCNMLNHVYSHNYIFSMCTPVLWFHIQKCSSMLHEHKHLYFFIQSLTSY